MFANSSTLDSPSFCGDDVKGTAEDGLLYICTRGTELRWAFVVLVRTGESVHAVLVPILEDPIAIEVFLKFLRNDDSEFDAAWTKYDGEVACHPLRTGILRSPAFHSRPDIFAIPSHDKLLGGLVDTRHDQWLT